MPSRLQSRIPLRHGMCVMYPYPWQVSEVVSSLPIGCSTAMQVSPSSPSSTPGTCSAGSVQETYLDIAGAHRSVLMAAGAGLSEKVTTMHAVVSRLRHFEVGQHKRVSKLRKALNRLDITFSFLRHVNDQPLLLKDLLRELSSVLAASADCEMTTETASPPADGDFLACENNMESDSSAAGGPLPDYYCRPQDIVDEGSVDCFCDGSLDCGSHGIDCIHEVARISDGFSAHCVDDGDDHAVPRCDHFHMAVQTDLRVPISVGTQTSAYRQPRRSRCHGRACQTDFVDIFSASTQTEITIPNSHVVVERPLALALLRPTTDDCGVQCHSLDTVAADGDVAVKPKMSKDPPEVRNESSPGGGELDKPDGPIDWQCHQCMTSNFHLRKCCFQCMRMRS